MGAILDMFHIPNSRGRRSLFGSYSNVRDAGLAVPIVEALGWQCGRSFGFWISGCEKR